MKTIIFYACLLIAIALLVNIVFIFIEGLEQLTTYGYAYLFGKIIVFLGFATLSYFLGKRTSRK
ncbi:hypothetical protein [Haloflavibacter putidus]|uniref:DUF378 domain-containing protein n=1 Tax=Haloflavibacter putidus TaxID=2576776 RepID=A0A507ZRJ0_9FLAO|nr:hypothetical protein [Haloflavibacter putidus]TQD40406.1 hypothetical protein FKR84_00050 [Haloflavibacter putidus]